MKKLILMAAFVVATIGVNAQASFGVQVGGNMSKIEEKETEPGEPEWKSDYDSKIGFLIGVLAEVPLTDNLSFRPELNFIQKGAKVDMTETESSGGFTSTSVIKGETTLNFIELPLNLTYSVDAGMGKVFFGIGPNIGFGLSGKSELKMVTTVSGPGFPTQVIDESEEGDVKFDGKKDADLAAGDNDFHLKRLDFGANVLAGYKMANGLSFSLGYTRGFSNLNPNDNQSFKTSGIQLKIAYIFGGGAPAGE